jgi:hypothetical protein
MQEQIIQDAITNHPRLKKVLELLGYKDLAIDTNAGITRDLLNQEFNFKVQDPALNQCFGARLDVIATFNGRTQLVIIETKSIAAPEDIEQLKFYLDYCHLLKEQPGLNLDRIASEKTIGILLANSFVPGEYKLPNNRIIHLVTLDMQDEKQPFKKFDPLAVEKSDLPIASVFKNSNFYTVDDHRNYLKSTRLRELFDQLKKFALSESDSRVNWIAENPKSGHLAIHYKGIYAAYFFVRQKYFVFGYGPNNDTLERIQIDESSDTVAVLADLRPKLEVLLNTIDIQAKAAGIPDHFSWQLYDKS